MTHWDTSKTLPDEVLDRCRDEIDMFRHALMTELVANQFKGDWADMGDNVVLHGREIAYHLTKLMYAMKRGDGPAIMEHAADVATGAMIAAINFDAMREDNITVKSCEWTEDGEYEGAYDEGMRDDMRFFAEVFTAEVIMRQAQG